MRFTSPHHYDQEFCTRCNEKSTKEQLVSMVIRIPRSTQIILICPKCVSSFIKWLADSGLTPDEQEIKERIIDSFSDETKEDMK